MRSKRRPPSCHGLRKQTSAPGGYFSRKFLSIIFSLKFNEQLWHNQISGQASQHRWARYLTSHLELLAILCVPVFCHRLIKLGCWSGICSIWQCLMFILTRWDIKRWELELIKTQLCPTIKWWSVQAYLKKAGAGEYQEILHYLAPRHRMTPTNSHEAQKAWAAVPVGFQGCVLRTKQASGCCGSDCCRVLKVHQSQIMELPVRKSDLRIPVICELVCGLISHGVARPRSVLSCSLPEPVGAGPA